MAGVSVFVLAGGRSSRMGTDKALLPFGDGNLLQFILGKAKQISPTATVVGATERYSAYGDVIEDRYRDCGPLGGIHAALCATQSDLNLVLSVDMPLMTVDFCRWLMRVSAAGKELVVIPEAGGRLQPLCAIYRRAARCVIDQALKTGDFKISHIFPLLPTRYISEGEIRAEGFSSEMFRNLNTPEDYEAVAAAWRHGNSKFAAGNDQ